MNDIRMNNAYSTDGGLQVAGAGGAAGHWPAEKVEESAAAAVASSSLPAAAPGRSAGPLPAQRRSGRAAELREFHGAGSCDERRQSENQADRQHSALHRAAEHNPALTREQVAEDRRVLLRRVLKTRCVTGPQAPVTQRSCACSGCSPTRT